MDVCLMMANENDLYECCKKCKHYTEEWGCEAEPNEFYEEVEEND